MGVECGLVVEIQRIPNFRQDAKLIPLSYLQKLVSTFIHKAH